MKDYYTLDEVLTLRHQLEAEALKEGFKFENVLTNRYATGFTKGYENLKCGTTAKELLYGLLLLFCAELV